MATVVFVHAHPDDEAIFTAGTMRLLADAGHRVLLALATGGELGEARDGVHGTPTALAARRRAETAAAAARLGVDAVLELGFVDSGMAGDPANHFPGTLHGAGPAAAATALLTALDGVAVDVLVGYDPVGIYGHPDHVAVHRLVHTAARELGVATVYDATVDREYLHFVETHLVEEALLAGDLGLVRSHLGTATAEITTTVDAGAALAHKRAAMADHASQIPETTSALILPEHHFADVYRYEWYVRHGPVSVLDEL